LTSQAAKVFGVESMKKMKVSLTLETDLIIEVDKIVMKRREKQKDERVLKVTSRSEVAEELIRKGLASLRGKKGDR